ncbi:helix-turn-helix family protein [endosymbiont of Acanthamoeba sp. UWC8]|uniref:hypothetical protein n=1 Tax=endosymbiont of Acanthamoeba sp. UWC8 TaxID=86106 RepID=UPI0004D11AB9|nr:hypothetical protein [endosymbiont of Acanthamoeba sp. UWC8]AIF80648.1 helix-turn-helix family protein [endosymbiont of Acanthamoeba sp. UWC8]
MSENKPEYVKQIVPTHSSHNITVLEGIPAFIKVMENVFEVMNKNSGIVRLSGHDRRIYFQYFGDEYMIKFYNLLSELNNVVFRCLVVGEKNEYLVEERKAFVENRFIPNKYFSGISTYIYHNKIAYLMWQSLKVVLIENTDLALAHKNQFDLIWNEVAK